MLFVLLSPAKTMDFSARRTGLASHAPHFAKDAATLAGILAEKSPQELEKLMRISPKLAALNAARYKAYIPAPKAGTVPDGQQFAPAVLAYRGDTYSGLNADDLSDDDLAYAHDHTGILSGFYGLLQPLDLIQPYRLEMGTRLAVGKHPDLYHYWGQRLVTRINALVEANNIKAVIGCASNEYLDAVDRSRLAVPFIQCAFMEKKNGKTAIVGLFAKRARGAMARFIIENRITDPQQLQSFDATGYAFAPELSGDTQFVFTR